MKARSLLWKVPLALVGVVLGIVLLLLVAVAIGLYIPSVRQKVVDKAVVTANEYTDYDIDAGRIYLSPFHHSPMVFYRAYKGESDLPLCVEIDSLFVGHRGQDTLAYIHSLRVRATALTKGKQSPFNNILNLPIAVEQLYLDHTVFHSDSLIEAVGIDALVGELAVTSPQLLIAQGQYPLHHLRLNDADVAIDLRETPPDTTAQDTTPLLLTFDLPDGELRNIHFRLTPVGLDIGVASLSTKASIDVGNNRYDAQRLAVGKFVLGINELRIPIDTIYGSAVADIATNHIATGDLHAQSDELGARIDLAVATMNLETMCVVATGDAEFQGSKAHLRASYDINNEAYDATIHIDRVNLAPFLNDSTPIILAGDVEATGQGFDPNSRKMKSRVKLDLQDAVYGSYDVSGLRLNANLANGEVTGDLHLPVQIKDSTLQVSAQTGHQFRVAQFMTPKQMLIDYHSQIKRVNARIGGFPIRTDQLNIDFATDSTTSVQVQTDGLDAAVHTPMHVLTFVNALQPLLTSVSDSNIIHSLTSLEDLTVLDTLRRQIPALQADIALHKGSPLQAFIDSTGLALEEALLAIRSDSLLSSFNFQLSTLNSLGDSTALRLPAARAGVRVGMTEGQTDASLTANMGITDGVMSIYDLCTDVDLRFNLKREGKLLNGDGRLIMDSLAYDGIELGTREVDMQISPSEEYASAIRADVQLSDLPMELIKGIVNLPDIDLHGMVRATASVDGLPGKTDISAEVQPIGVGAEYTPYNVAIGLGNTPIVMRHNQIDLNGLPIYGADSTFISLDGGLNIDSMRVNVTIEADSFAPVKLPKDGPIPVYGDLATDIHGRVSGPLDSILVDVGVTILPTTDITYPIDKKNLAQVKPYGTVNVRYGTADGSLDLGGQVNVDDGFVKYSPKIYPVMPFHVDSGSHVAFNGPLGQTMLNVSASQQVKADVESSGQETRRVDFRTGVRVGGVLDSIGLNSIGFFLEAPKDEAVTRELASVDEDTREGLAATLLATGMYVGESNAAAEREGYALSSIVNSRINAAMANSKMGKFIDVDISSGQTNHAPGKTNDMNVTLSKSFFKDKLRVTIGSTISDNPDVNKTNGLLSNITADYKLTKDGNVLLQLFAKRDYNNVLEGELYKSGLGVRATKDWQRKQLFRGDSIMRTYGLTADADVVYRSNNSIGPDITLKPTIKNLFGRGESFTLKANGAYYWALRNRFPGDPKKTDTYKLGANASLLFPYLHWGGENNPDGDTRYMLGYQYENIAGGYGVHKLSGSFTYFIRSPYNQYITHAFTPFSLSVVLMKAESASLLDKAAEYPQLIKVMLSDEFVPSIGYNFVYNDYRAKRAVNTSLDLTVKESGNLINAIYMAFGYKWSDQDKPLGKLTFNQFVKLSAELRNKFNLTDKVAIATRLFAGSNIPLGNSSFAPLSEAFYTGGPHSLRASSPSSYGPGNFYSTKYNQSFFHAGDVKLEANFELRFPIVWKLYGAAFVDAGNVWNWYSTVDLFKAAGQEELLTKMEIPETLYDGIYNNPDFARQIALGTGAGLRLDIDGLVIRLDLGVAIHAPYQTYKYNKEGKVDTSQPINTYFNIPSALDALRVNFGIGYPF